MREQKKRDKVEEMKKKKAAIAEWKAIAAEKRATAAEKKAAAALKKVQQANYLFYKTRCNAAVINSDTPSSSTSAAASEWECPFCFECYNKDDQEDWVKCGCGRWTHESCITDVIVDSAGKELFCLYCSV